ncbi:MAG: hypothetical protein GY787_02700 [Alteromonadales bacterium]|nr:hypothetical protein [Alteromonadales bacterium]MCP4991225.1 hypothetical protein [Colwellia sp.]
MQKAYEINGNPQHLYALCDMQVNRQAFEAKQCIEALEQVVPANAVQSSRARLAVPRP